MKSFSAFIQEAVISRAVEKAKRLGLVSDGHGNWYDRQGSYRGRTYKGDLLLSKEKGPKEGEPQSQQQRAAAPQPTGQPAAQERPESSRPSGDGESEGAKKKRGRDSYYCIWKVQSSYRWT